MSQFDSINPRKYDAEITSDFVTATTEGGFAESTSGTGAAASITSAAGHPGVLNLTSGTTGTGYAFVGTNVVTGLYSDGGVLRVDALVKFANLSDASQEYSAAVGFGDVVTTHDQTDGAYFYYDRANDGDNFFIATAKAGTRTEVNTNFAVVADTWYKLSVVVEGTSAYFYIDDVPVGTISTNVPDTTSNLFGIVAGLLKSVGTTARTMDVDYINAKISPASDR